MYLKPAVYLDKTKCIEMLPHKPCSKIDTFNKEVKTPTQHFVKNGR